MRSAGKLTVEPASKREVKRWLESAGEDVREWTGLPEVKARLSMCVDGTPVALSFSMPDAEHEGALLLLAPRLGLRSTERIFLEAARGHMPADGEGDRVALHLLPQDGAYLPAARALGFVLDKQGSMPPRGTARLVLHRYVLDGLTRTRGA